MNNKVTPYFRENLNAKKIPNEFQGCHENALIESFKMSPHLIVHNCHSQTLLWPASSRPNPKAGHKRVLEWQLRTIKWGLILKLSMRAFAWQPWNSLGIFSAFQVSLPDRAYQPFSCLVFDGPCLVNISPSISLYWPHHCNNTWILKKNWPPG